MADPIDLEEVRKLAERLRKEGEAQIAEGNAKVDRAKAIEHHSVALMGLTSESDPAAVIPTTQSGRRGKQPGAISSVWKENLQGLHAVTDGRSFDAPEAAAALKMLTPVSFAPSQVIRQFEPYVAAGYLDMTSGRYRFTDDCLRKIGAQTMAEDKPM